MAGERYDATGDEIPPGGIPRGIEVLVKKAAVDPGFRALLLEKRADAARQIALELDPAEEAMLAAIPASQFEAIIASTKVDDQVRPAFLGRAAAVMIAALGAGASACAPRIPELERLSNIKGLTARIAITEEILEKERGLAAAAEDPKERRLHERRVSYLEGLLDKEKRAIQRARERRLRMYGTKGHRADRP
ncbi:MAG: hypothetical protein ACYS9X_11225 [Planctomycetota bacterium]|jgi:hypothetical protein